MPIIRNTLNYLNYYTGSSGKLNFPNYYDHIVHAPGNFDSLRASPTWDGATNVLVVCNGQYIVTETISVPVNVKELRFVNSNATNPIKIIETLNENDESDFTGESVFSGAANNKTVIIGAYVSIEAGYNTESGAHLESGTKDIYAIDDCTVISSGAYLFTGVYNSSSIRNCNVDVSADIPFGITDSHNIESTTVVVINGDNGIAFSDCTNISNSTGSAGPLIGAGTCSAFYNCSYLVNCRGSSVYDVTSDFTSYAFDSVDHCSNCGSDGITSTGGLFGGSNTHIDTDSCN